MPANNATIKKDATAMTPTGGTDVTYTLTGKSIAGGIQVQDASVTDFTVRPLAEMKSRPPELGKDGYYTKRKTEFKHVVPLKRADGSTVFSVWRIINESPVELTASAFADQKFRAAQFISDSDLSAFWSDGSTTA